MKSIRGSRRRLKGLLEIFLNVTIRKCKSASILANALHFKGAWSRHQFDESTIRCDNFYALNGDIYQVPFIHSWDDRYSYASSKGFKILSLPYENYWENYWNRNNTKERFAMYLFLPDAKDGLLDLLGQFSSNPDLLT